jgi:lysophospholipase L1-like esterase
MGTKKLSEFSRDQLDGAIGGAASKPLRLVWIGDSTGRGVGETDPDHALPRVVATGLDRPVQPTVLAVSGARISDALNTQLPQLRALHSDWVIVCIGGNDVTHLTSRSAFRLKIEQLLSGIDAEQPSHVIVLGIGQFASTPLFAQPLRWIAGLRARELDSNLRAAADRHHALFVSIIDRVGRDFVRDPARYHARDRFHPSDDGYALWARATLDAIRAAGW